MLTSGVLPSYGEKREFRLTVPQCNTLDPVDSGRMRVRKVLLSLGAPQETRIDYDAQENVLSFILTCASDTAGRVLQALQKAGMQDAVQREAE